VPRARWHRIADRLARLLPPDLAAQISLSDADQAKLRTPDYGYMARMAPDVLDFWNREFKA
jgi:putative spermidine/putrescine transport system substrate-binding protein